jgi:ubiquinone/menaquinone biosynthesis C-methylase UbiE
MAYTSFDQFVARLRYRVARPHIRPQSRVCDVGCGLAAGFLDYASERIAYGVGVDYQVQPCVSCRWLLTRADIRASLPFHGGQFDHVVMLAVLEHLTHPEVVLRETYRVLAPGGSLILTWPSQLVDPLLWILRGVGLVSDETETKQHQPRLPVPELREMLQHIGFQGFVHRSFECGVNNLLVAYRRQ